MHQDASPTDMLRRAIKDDDRTVFRIATEAGVSHTILSRFMAGQRGLNTATLDRVCRVLRLGLRPVRRAA